MPLRFYKKMNIYAGITDHFIKKGYIKAEDRDVFIYGFDIIAYTVWSTAVLLLFGLVFHQFKASVFIILLFYIFQSCGGGYHAHSHLQCLSGMILGLIAGFCFIFLCDIPVVLTVLMCIGFLMLIIFPIVIHPNKKHLEKNRRSLAIRSICITLIVSAISAVTVIRNNEMLYIFAASFFLSGLSRTAGHFLYDR